MIMRNRRAITAAFLAGLVTAAGLMTSAPAAQAYPVTSGTFTLTGDPGDWITAAQPTATTSPRATGCRSTPATS